jgi:hypothetical protein
LLQITNKHFLSENVSPEHAAGEDISEEDVSPEKELGMFKKSLSDNSQYMTSNYLRKSQV